ncbi:hypothetical protein HYFRA_00005239 [Hymenoscyphus fraxineus]|uniref:DUF6594 domain-containing protein n=1 Tax=Hymenoscyphus fraxineus TaxID=746836 RepID=A0A9N9LCY3_9HELO|nr:hypothetical protein HYFRA_00005239 [Hymenoscyphus fraxineus]
MASRDIVAVEIAIRDDNPDIHTPDNKFFDFIKSKLTFRSMKASGIRQMLRKTKETISNVLSLKKASTDGQDKEEIVGKKQIEDYKPGYPQYCSLISAHTPYHICRRFTQMRARLLLLKQDQLSLLEDQLEQIDNAERCPIFLGNSRIDINPARKQILSEIQIGLREYDEIIEKNRKVLSYPTPKPRDLTNLTNWIENSASLAAEETGYLSKPDLLTIGMPIDEPLLQVELLLEHVIMFCYEIFNKRPKIDLSRDPNVFIFSNPLLKRITRGLIAWIVVLILFVPVIVINSVSGVAVRMGVIVVASAVVIMTLALMTKVKTWEMFLACAT